MPIRKYFTAVSDGIKVSRAAKVLPNGTEALFTITGNILLMNLIGSVTVALGATPTNIKVQGNPTATGASVDLCANLAAANKPVATLLSITGTPSDAMQSGLAIVGSTKPILLQPGTIDIVTDAQDTGEIAWDLWYRPMSTGATVAAA